jgi:hypothetical protein
MAIIGENRSMRPSGAEGGTPMVSKPGKQTISNYVCFSNGVKLKVEDEFELDPNHVPADVLETKLKMEMKGMDAEYIQQFIQEVKEKFSGETVPEISGVNK